MPEKNITVHPAGLQEYSVFEQVPDSDGLNLYFDFATDVRVVAMGIYTSALSSMSRQAWVDFQPQSDNTLSPLCYPIPSTDSVSTESMYIETEQRLFPAGSRLYFQSDNDTGSVMDVAFTLLVEPA